MMSGEVAVLCYWSTESLVVSVRLVSSNTVSVFVSYMISGSIVRLLFSLLVRTSYINPHP